MRTRSRRGVLNGLFYGDTVGQELEAADDNVVAGFDAAEDDVVIPNNIADLDLLVARDGSFRPIRRKKNEKLAVQSLNSKHGYFEPLGGPR